MPQLINVKHLEDGISELNINAPEIRNCLSDELCAEMMDALSRLGAEPQLKVLLLTGRADVFCAGATLEVLNEIAAGNYQVADLALPDQLLAFPVPIIAALQGHAVGGGLALALCCDVLVAAAESRYGFNFTTLGFTPGLGTTGLLPALVGHHFASEMLLTAKYYRGHELQGRGLFNHVVPAGEVYHVAFDLAQRLAEKSRHVLEMTKQTLALPRRQLLQAARVGEELMHRICFSDPGTKALINDRYLDD
ncbi:MAG: polyketide synthase [Chloroflexi bacterium]|nr:polyketide synthase [Chloroflexota bacterium]MCI0581192.1 polyketide synthase [Chloroflexota bacterium]MCI0644116.1 polyketide synthase [Chloroflexota bacterium]MCI0731737.1 polyketide synthase [Chloroflexota bacterium]